tara:strand:- start:749 stop:1501 length:753 start_codon:yes stop_codon:yes gene_type:complete
MKHVVFDKNGYAVCKHPRFLKLQHGIEQCTPAWFKQRKGRLTGSKYTNFYFINSEEEYEAYWQQVWAGGPRKPFSDEAKGYMEYGKTHEDIALSFFLEQRSIGDIYVAEAPFFRHTLDYLGASPDGIYAIYDGKLLKEQGVIEIKCPAKNRRPYAHFKHYYVAQTYAEMACSGLKSTIAISWGPRNMRAWRWRWDDKVWNTISNIIEGFRTHVPYAQFKELQHELEMVSHEVSNNAECLHSGTGFPISIG